MLTSICDRGTNDTLLFECYASPELRAAVSLPPAGNSSDTARDHIWAEATVRADTCAARGNDTGHYLGTASVARDHRAVAQALGEGDSFRFWGTCKIIFLRQPDACCHVRLLDLCGG